MSDNGVVDRRLFIAWMSALPAAAVLAAGAEAGASAGSGGGGSAPGDRGDGRSGLVKAEDLLLAPGLVYLQTGSAGPTLRPVMERTIAAWRELEQSPTLQGYRLGPPLLEEVRTKAAALVNCAHDEIVLTRNTTDGMNAVACGLGLSAGDRVLTTDQEHHGGRACWDYLARQRGIEIDVVAIPPGENDARAIVDRFRAAIAPKTRVLSFSHVLYSTGLRMPVAELSALTAEHGCTSVVDGAQGPGGIAVDVAALGCDVYVTTGNKWLLGPKGTGFLCLRERARERVRLMCEQEGRKAQSDSTGLTNVPGMIGLGAAIDAINSFGVAEIEAHNLALRNTLFEMLKGVANVRIVSPAPGPLASPLLTVQLPDRVQCADLGRRMLEAHQVALRPIPGLPNGIRFSTHLFNSVEDVERGVKGLREEVG